MAKKRHKEELKTEEKWANLRGNTNAVKGEHDSLVVRLPVSVVDGLYECLRLDGELVTEDPQRIYEFALAILSGYVRRRVEFHESIIL